MPVVQPRKGVISITNFMFDPGLNQTPDAKDFPHSPRGMNWNLHIPQGTDIVVINVSTLEQFGHRWRYQKDVSKPSKKRWISWWMTIIQSIALKVGQPLSSSSKIGTWHGKAWEVGQLKKALTVQMMGNDFLLKRKMYTNLEGWDFLIPGKRQTQGNTNHWGSVAFTQILHVHGLAFLLISSCNTRKLYDIVGTWNQVFRTSGINYSRGINRSHFSASTVVTQSHDPPEVPPKRNPLLKSPPKLGLGADPKLLGKKGGSWNVGLSSRDCLKAALGLRPQTSLRERGRLVD